MPWVSDFIGVKLQPQPPHSYATRAEKRCAREHPKDVDELIEEWLEDFGKEYSLRQAELRKGSFQPRNPIQWMMEKYGEIWNMFRVHIFHFSAVNRWGITVTVTLANDLPGIHGAGVGPERQELEEMSEENFQRNVQVASKQPNWPPVRHESRLMTWISRDKPSTCL